METTSLKIYKPDKRNYKLKLLIYGPPGVGKTTFAATADAHPLTKKVLFINVEGGMLSVTDLQHVGIQDPPDVVDYEGPESLEKIFWYLATGDHPYQTVCIDSLSELQMVNLEEIMKDLVGINSKSKSKRSSIDDIWLEDYNSSTQQLRRIIRKFRDLPMHVIFTCHDRSDADKSKNMTTGPSLTPKVRTSVCGYMDVVGYMFSDLVDADNGGTQTVRKLLVSPYDQWIAKDRSPGNQLGMVIENPSVPTLMNKILGGE